MPARFVNVDHDTPLLLPPNLREWVPQGHLVHFIMDAVGELDVRPARVNERGSGDAQYPPAMMLGLLIYSYASGLFSSRQIERASHDSVAVRLLCADTHPDHDTICAFRRQNAQLLSRSFAQVVELAARCGVLKVGGITVAIDGSKVLASASKHAAVSYGHAGARMQELDLEIAQLLAKAEQADSTPLEDGLSVPTEIERRQERKAKLAQARAEMEARARVRLEAERAEHERLCAQREARRAAGQKHLGREPKAPREGPGPSDQVNFSDPESRIMKAGGGDHSVQAYNAQAAVEVESRLIVGQRVSDAPNDKEQLLPTLGAVEPAAGPGEHSRGAGALQTASANRRTGLWHHQRGNGLSAFFAARPGQSQPGMDAREPGVQFATLTPPGRLPANGLKPGKLSLRRASAWLCQPLAPSFCAPKQAPKLLRAESIPETSFFPRLQLFLLSARSNPDRLLVQRVKGITHLLSA